MLALRLGQIAEQFAYPRVPALLHGAFVKTPRLQFHDLDLLADSVDSQGANQPHGKPMDKALDVLAPDQGDVLAKALPIDPDQAGPMFGLLRLHLLEHLGGSRVSFAEPIDEIPVDPAVLLFQ